MSSDGVGLPVARFFTSRRVSVGSISMLLSTIRAVIVPLRAGE
jgi:hypothetical protein